MLYSNKLFSIIIIFHNSEKTIRKCLESIVNQDKIELCQIVLINDCSDDDSLEIVTDILKDFSFEYIIHSNEKNLGISASRQKGLDLSTGQYIYYIDSDDYIEDKFVDFSNNLISKFSYDIVFFDYYLEYPNKPVLRINQKIDINNIVFDIISGKTYGFLWNKIIRRNLFYENNIAFTKDVDMWEDALVVAKVCSKADSLFHCKQAYLHYIQTDSSCIHKKMNDKIASSMQICIEDFKKNFKDKRFIDAINLRIIEYHVTLFLRSDYSLFQKYSRYYPMKIYLIFKARQYKFILRLIYFFYIFFPSKLNFYFFAGGYKLCTKIIKKIQKKN